MLSSAELAVMRGVAEGTFVDTCDIIRTGAATYDGQGEAPGSETRTSVKCRVAPGQYRADEGVSGGALMAVASWKVALPAGTDVRTTDRIEVTSGMADGKVFHVVSVQARSHEVARVVLCQEIGA